MGRRDDGFRVRHGVGEEVVRLGASGGPQFLMPGTRLCNLCFYLPLVSVYYYFHFVAVRRHFCVEVEVEVELVGWFGLLDAATTDTHIFPDHV